MTEKKLVTQIGVKIRSSDSAALQRMAAESGQTVTTVARALLMAAIRQAEEGEAKPMPAYLRRFYGEPEVIDELEE